MSPSSLQATQYTINKALNQEKKQLTSPTNQPPFRIAINGFGRIGRNVLRALLERGVLDKTHIQLVAINDVAEAQALILLLKYDSTYGRLTDIGYKASLLFNESVSDRLASDHSIHDTDIYLKLDNQQKDIHHHIQLLNSPSPKDMPWNALEVDLILECTGHFRSYQEANNHRIAGAKQVIIGAAPFDEVDACIVMGVNDKLLNRQLPIISSVSCTTQAIVPLIATLDEAFGVTSAMMTEIHAVTADQNVLDQAHRDPRRARASGYNIIPTSSSSIKATERVLPNMTGKINGYSMRVPTIDVAAIDVTFTFDTAVELSALRHTLKQATLGNLAGVMSYTDEPLVSSDFVHQSESLIVDELQVMQVGTQYKVFAWYDNEWGYANRLVDMCITLSKTS